MEGNKILDAYNTVAGTVIALLTAIFGMFWYVFVTFMILNIVDYLTGWYKARKLKQRMFKDRTKWNIEEIRLLGGNPGSFFDVKSIRGTWK